MVDIDSREQLRDFNVLVRSVSDLNVARTDQNRLAPIRQRRYIGKKRRYDRRQRTYGLHSQERDFVAIFDSRESTHCVCNSFSQLIRRANGAEEQAGFCMIWHNIRSSSTFDETNVHSGWTNLEIDWHFNRTELMKRFDQLFNRGFAKFGVTRMSHSAFRQQVQAQRAFCGQRDSVTRRLTIDEELARRSQCIRGFRSCAVALFSDNE